MSLVNNSANNFKDFLDAIKPFLNYQFYDLSGQGVEANNFSTDEKVIGTWIDGKPLYQKTVDCGALPNNTTKEIAHGISNIDKVINIKGIVINASANTYLNIPTITINQSLVNYQIGMDVNNTYVRILTGIDRSSYSAYVTLKYTKTTDSPVASGEKIVGQWIDGKPVFEKTITGLSITVNQDSWVSPVDLSISVDVLVNAMFYGNGGIYVPKEYLYSANGLVLQGNGNSNRSIDTITLRYTKSS